MPERLLRIELAQFERPVRRLLPIDLEQHQFGPILSVTYNLSAGALQASTLRSGGGYLTLFYIYLITKIPLALGGSGLF